MSWTAKGGLAALSTAAVLGTAGVTVAVAGESDETRIDTSPVTQTPAPPTEDAPDGLALRITGVLDAALNRTARLTDQYEAWQLRAAAAKREQAQARRALQKRTARVRAAAEAAEREAAESASRRTATPTPIPVETVAPDDDSDDRDVRDRGGKHRGKPDAREQAQDRRREGDNPGKHRGWDRERGWERHGDDRGQGRGR
jgi:hypothetical protein